MNPPANPHAAEQRAAVQAHMAQARGETYPPPAPAEPTPHAELLDRVFEHWPDMERYRETARIERIDYCLNDEWRWCWCITITA